MSPSTVLPVHSPRIQGRVLPASPSSRHPWLWQQGPVSASVVTCLVLCLCLLFCRSRDSLSLGLAGITRAFSPPCLAASAKSLVPKRLRSEDPGGCGFWGTLVTPEHTPWSSSLPQSCCSPQCGEWLGSGGCEPVWVAGKFSGFKLAVLCHVLA